MDQPVNSVNVIVTKQESYSDVESDELSVESDQDSLPDNNEIMNNQPKENIININDDQNKRNKVHSTIKYNDLMQKLSCKLVKRAEVFNNDISTKKAGKVQTPLADDKRNEWVSITDELEHKLHWLKNLLDENYSCQSTHIMKSANDGSRIIPHPRMPTPPPAKSSRVSHCKRSVLDESPVVNDRESEALCSDCKGSSEIPIKPNTNNLNTTVKDVPIIFRRVSKFKNFEPNIHLSKKCLNLVTNIVTATGKQCLPVNLPNFHYTKHKVKSHRTLTPTLKDPANPSAIKFKLKNEFKELSNINTFLTLKTVNLSHQNLVRFPEILTSLPFLVCLDLSWNCIGKVPVFTGSLRRLEHLILSHNQIERGNFSTLNHLKQLNLKSNQITVIPTLPLQDLMMLDLSNNLIWNVNKPLDESGNNAQQKDKPVVLKLKKNRLSGGVTLASLQHVTELDVSENGITCLDVSSLTSLQSLVCSNNEITRLSIHGASLVKLISDNNKLSSIHVRSHPRKLSFLDVSRNCLNCIPPWMVSCSQIYHLNVSENYLTSLPVYLTSGHLQELRVLCASRNNINAIPKAILTPPGKQQITAQNEIEVLKLDRNKIRQLPDDFFSSFCKLRLLNLSSNQLSSLPYICDDEPAPPLQEFYAANNDIMDISPLEECFSLRILHVPYNRIHTINERSINSWELLEELVVSGNQLTQLPTSISRLARLRVLGCHLNQLSVLPRLSHIPSLKVLDASYCNLGRVEFESVFGPSLATLDLASNPSLCLDRRQFSKCKSRRPINVVNATIGPQQSPFEKKTRINELDIHSQTIPQSRLDVINSSNTNDLPWSIGFSETNGLDKRLFISQMRIPNLGADSPVGAVALVSSPEDPSVSSAFAENLPRFLQNSNFQCSSVKTQELKMAVTSCLQETSSKYSSSIESMCVACLDVSKRSSFDPRGTKTMTYGVDLRIFSYGEVMGILCSGEASPIVASCQDYQDLANNGDLEWNSLESIRIRTSLIRVEAHHQSLVIGSHSVWEVLGVNEVNEICRDNTDPLLAAKQMIILAQSYGAKGSLSCIVIQLTSPQYLNQVKNNISIIKPNLHMNNVTQKHFTEDDSDSTDTQNFGTTEYIRCGVTKIDPTLYHDNEVFEDPYFPSYISPPKEFADSDSEGSSDDSGFSYKSDNKSYSPIDPTTGSLTSDEQDQLENYIYGKVYSPMTRRHQSQWVSSLSTPDIVFAANHETSNKITKTSSFSSSSRRLSKELKKCLQNTIYIHAPKKLSSFHNFRFGSGTFKRFGSLQSLKSYQRNKNINHKSDYFHRQPNVNKRPEMQEKRTLDRIDLDSRMKQYWESGVTCF